MPNTCETSASVSLDIALPEHVTELEVSKMKLNIHVLYNFWTCILTFSHESDLDQARNREEEQGHDQMSVSVAIYRILRAAHFYVKCRL